MIMNINDTPLIAVIGSLKYKTPMTAIRNVPIPAHNAYARLTSRRFKDNVKNIKENV
jgi:hypothetical protein